MSNGKTSDLVTGKTAKGLGLRSLWPKVPIEPWKLRQDVRNRTKMLKELFSVHEHSRDVEILIRRAQGLVLTAAVDKKTTRSIAERAIFIAVFSIFFTVFVATAATLRHTPTAIIHFHTLLLHPVPSPFSSVFSDYLLTLVVYCLVGMLIYVLSFSPLLLLTRNLGRLKAVEPYLFALILLCTTLIQCFIVLYCLAVVRKGYATWAHFFLGFGTFMALLTNISLVVFVIVMAFMQSYIQRLIYRQNPEAHLFDSLLLCLSQARHDKNWERTDHRRNMIAALEKATEHLGDHLRAALMPDDAALAAWWKTEILRRTAGIIELRKWVLLPKSDTKRQFLDRLQTLILKIVQRDWDGIPTASPQEITRAVWAERVYSGVQSIISAALPFGIYFAVQRSRLALIPPYSEYLKALLFGWCVITLLLSIDSSFGTKFEILRNLSQAIKFGKKD